MNGLLPGLAGLRLGVPTGAPKKRAKVAVRPFYGILQLTPDATPDEIRRNYLLLSRKVHPDKNPGDDQAAARYIQLKEAYDTLSDPDKRARYDRGGSAGDDSAAFAEAYAFFRGTPIDTNDIDAYLDGYRGSVVEEEDLLSFFRENDGDLAQLLSFIIGSRDEDVPRYLAFFEAAIKAGRLPRKYANRKKYPFTVTPEGELEGAPLYDGGEEEELSEEEEDDGAGPLMHEELLPEEPPEGVPPALWAALRAGQERRNQRARLALTDKRGAPTGADNDGGDQRRGISIREWKRRRAEAELARNTPITTLKQPGPFDTLVEMLANRLNFDTRKEVAGADADVLCKRVAQVCNELAVLNNLPALRQENKASIDPDFDCANPDARVWKAAHVIFGVDPLADPNHQDPAHRKPPLTKLDGDTWRDSFRALCKVFGPPDQLQYEVFMRGSRWTAHSVWGELYKSSSLQRKSDVMDEEARRFHARVRALWLRKFGHVSSNDAKYKEYGEFKHSRRAYKLWMQHYPEEATLRTFQREVRNLHIARHEWIGFLIRTVEVIIEEAAYTHDLAPEERVVFARRGLPSWDSTDKTMPTMKQQIVAFQRDMCRLGNLFYVMKRQTGRFATSASQNPFLGRWELVARNLWDDDSDSEPETPEHIKREGFTMEGSGGGGGAGDDDGDDGDDSSGSDSDASSIGGMDGSAPPGWDWD